MFQNCPNPSPSHSVVTPTQVPALFKYSTRNHGPPVAGADICARVVGLLVSSPINGNPGHACVAPLLIGSTQPLVPAVAQPKYSVAPEVNVYGVAAAVGNWKSCPSARAPRSGCSSTCVSANRMRICALLYSREVP